MKRSPRPRETAKLSQSINQHLNMYVRAATAAGVGTLALAQVAEAKIIYTKTNIKVFSHGPGYVLDLTNSGTGDFIFSGWYVDTTGRRGQTLSIVPAWPYRSNVICWSAYDVKPIGAAAFPAGRRIGPSLRFGQTMAMGGLATNTNNGRHYFWGAWENGGKGVSHRYLGFKFRANGKMHYGWARLNFPNPDEATLTGYAYETVPNKPIITGKIKGPDVVTLTPGSLGHLARGASAIPAWRVKQTAALTH
jgi:hypothetical protein